ncbi:MAG: cation-translocating P-type ATPase, partial [Kiritimatiellaeota bacterium]|nr:cation-translocating P-type ATPase [Kiritimatiellota bacterium]
LVIETRSAEGAHAAIEKLIRLTPTTARRLGDQGAEEEIPAAQLSVGDRIRVLPGETVPADGLIGRGQTTLNEATGDKGPQDEVFAGTQNLTGAIEVTVRRVGEDTTLGHVRKLILAAEKTKLPLLRIMDRYMGYYTPAVLMLAGMVWFFTGDWSRVIALLVIACPCALILATPTAMVAALSTAARLGLLVKNVADLESAAHLTAVIFDKTGTLTLGKLGVARLAPREGVAPAELLRAAAGAERFSKHPAAVALVELAQQTGVPLPEPADFAEAPGRGVRAVVNGQPVLSGRASWLKAEGVSDPLLDQADAQATEGFSVIFVAAAGRYLGWIGFQDQIRPEAADCLKQLADLKISRQAMVTGDRAAVAQKVAEQIGCREFKADCLPQEKVDFIRAVQRDGYRVAFVGDGVNDAPALAAGDTGIAMGAVGSDIAIHSASVALMNNDLRRVPFLIRLSRGARRTIYQNLTVGGLFILGGLTLSGLGYMGPILAVLLHNVGSLIVVFNSARLIRLGDEPGESKRD